MHRTFLKLLSNYSSEKKPSDRIHFLGRPLLCKQEAKEMQHPLRSPLLYLTSATSQLHLLTRRQNLFFYLLKSEIRNLMSLCSQYQYQIDLIICPLQQVITCTGTLLSAANF